MLKNILASALTSFSLSDYCSTKTSRSFCYTLIRYCFCYFGVSAYAKSDSSSAIFYANITICSNEQRVAMQSEYAQRREVECNLLHHFIFLKNVCFCNCFVCFGFVCFCYLSRLFRICTSFSLYCLGFCSTIAVIDCASLIINSAIVTSSFTLRKIRLTHIKRKKNQLVFQNSSSSLCHFVASCLSCVAA